MSVTTVGDLLRQTTSRHPDRTALIEGSADAADRQRVTYRQLLERAERDARALIARYEPGTHIAVWSPNSVEWVRLQMAAALAGLPLVMLNPNLRPAEVSYVLGHSRSAAIFAARQYRDSAMADLARSLQPELPHLHDIFLLEDLAGLEDADVDLPAVSPDDCAQILYTSGTTGNPKGVLLSHAALTGIGRVGAEGTGLRDDAVWLLVLPLASVGGSAFAVMGILSQASTLLVMREFDIPLLIRLIAEERVAFFNGPTTVHIRILDHPDMKSADFSSLEVVTCGGSTVPPTLIESIEAGFGAECLTTYGLTEASGTVTLIAPGESAARKAVTVGRPAAGVEVEIRAVETRETLPAGEIGEICVRSPGNFRGYFEMEEATRMAIEPGGWLRTGDLGSMDEHGYVSVTGRLKDMVKRGGHNIYPREIEDVLAGHPAVAEVAVFGIPHRELGEEIAAAVRLAHNMEADGPGLHQWLFPRIAPHKIPREWRFVADFPVNANGKIQKFELQRRFTEGLL